MQPTSKNCFFNNYIEIYNHMELFKMYNHPLSFCICILVCILNLYDIPVLSRIWMMLFAMTEFQNII